MRFSRYSLSNLEELTHLKCAVNVLTTDVVQTLGEKQLEHMYDYNAGCRKLRRVPHDHNSAGGTLQSPPC